MCKTNITQIIIVILFFCSNNSVFSQNNNNFKEFQRILLNKETKNPVSYANLINLDTINTGTTTNESGKTSLPRKKWKNNDQIYISSLGYKDTIVHLTHKLTDTIFLSPKIYHLPEILVTTTSKSQLIGSFSRPIDDAKLGLFFNYAGMSHGVFVSPNKKQVGKRLKSIHFFITDAGPLNSSFSFRMMTSSVKLKDNKMYKKTILNDLHTSNIVVKSVQRGWNRIDIEEHKIKIPNESFIVSMSSLFTGEHLNWKHKNIQNYGASLGYYEEKNLPQIKSFLQMKEHFSIINDGEKGPIACIIVSYED